MGIIKQENTSDESATLLGMRRTLRSLRPTHYLFKIDSYSLLEDDKYESDIFLVRGFKWKLCLYPNGDAKRNGNGHVSLYLQIVEDKHTHPCGWEVLVDFKLFVYDKLNDKYLTIQGDGEKTVRRFYELKTQWGFPKLIPLDVFKDVSNGYLVDDCCVFRAEVFIIKWNDLKSYSLPKPKGKITS